MAAKIGIIGCGAVTQELHAPALLELQRRGIASVTAICDSSQPVLDAVGRLFPGAMKSLSLESFPEAECDIALVASPARFHSKHALHCFKAGLPVLCEKPMAASLDDATIMRQAAEDAGKLFAVGHVRRFFPAAQQIRQIVSEQRLGPLKSFRAKEGGSFGWPAKSASFFDRSTSGGGVLIDNGIHALDLLLWWFGEPESFHYEDDAMGGVEINCRLVMRYGSFQGTLQLSWDYEMPTGYYLKFENAWLYWHPYSSDQLKIGFPGSDRSIHGTMHSVSSLEFPAPENWMTSYYQHSFLSQWLNIINTMEGREELRVPAGEAIRSLAFVTKCYKNASFMEPPWFLEEERSRAAELSGISRE